MIALTQTLSKTIGISAACRALGVPRSSLYRWGTAPQRVGKTPRPTPPRVLSHHETAQVRVLLNSERFCDQSPRQVYATLLDEGVYRCSWRTMYRILAEHAEVQPRRQRSHGAYVKPELLATAPNQLWSWDITKLKGPVTWTYYYLYVILDVFSRYVPGWMIAEQESAALAAELIETSCLRQAIAPEQLTLHSDRGPAMKAKSLALLLADLGITKSQSRPQVSNDNPFSEAQFKTVKYHPTFPERFGSVHDARTWAQDFFAWYNDEHRHSALGLMTPAMVHGGTADKVQQQRQQVLDAAYKAHPERFVRGQPTLPKLPQAVWINPPKTAKNNDTEMAP